MTTALDEAIRWTLGREGGWYDGSDPRDPNPTMMGVTQATYDRYRASRKLPGRSVREIDMGEVEDIYRGYWSPAGCDMVGRLAGMALFDHSINAGPQAAARCLQRAVGANPDGLPGPKTRAAIAAFPGDDHDLAARICWERVRHYVDLAKIDRLRPNLLSWVHRVVLFREHWLAPIDSPDPGPTLRAA